MKYENISGFCLLVEIHVEIGESNIKADSSRIEWVCREGHSWEFRKWGKIIHSLESSVKTPLIAEAFKLQKEGEIIQKLCHTDRIFLKKYKLKKR